MQEFPNEEWIRLFDDRGNIVKTNHAFCHEISSWLIADGRAGVDVIDMTSTYVTNIYYFCLSIGLLPVGVDPNTFVERFAHEGECGCLAYIVRLHYMNYLKAQDFSIRRVTGF